MCELANKISLKLLEDFSLDEFNVLFNHTNFYASALWTKLFLKMGLAAIFIFLNQHLGNKLLLFYSL